MIKFVRDIDCHACACDVLTLTDGTQKCATCPWDGMPSQLVCGRDEADDLAARLDQ